MSSNRILVFINILLLTQITCVKITFNTILCLAPVKLSVSCIIHEVEIIISLTTVDDQFLRTLFEDESSLPSTNGQYTDGLS